MIGLGRWRKPLCAAHESPVRHSSSLCSPRYRRMRRPARWSRSTVPAIGLGTAHRERRGVHAVRRGAGEADAAQRGRSAGLIHQARSGRRCAAVRLHACCARRSSPAAEIVWRLCSAPSLIRPWAMVHRWSCAWRVSRWAVTIRAWDDRVVDPSASMLLDTYGWTPGATLYAHYVAGALGPTKHSRSLPQALQHKNVKLGALDGPVWQPEEAHQAISPPLCTGRRMVGLLLRDALSRHGEGPMASFQGPCAHGKGDVVAPLRMAPGHS